MAELGRPDTIDPQLLSEHQRILIDLARIVTVLGNADEALRLSRQAGALADQLAKLTSQRDDVLMHVAIARNSPGFQLANKGKLAEAISEYESASDLYERLLTRSSNPEMLRFHAAATLNNWAGVQRRLGDAGIAGTLAAKNGSD